MKSIHEEFDRRHGHQRVEAMFPVSRLLSWIRRRKGKDPPYAWAYECGCEAPEGARSPPYCPEHGMRLMRYQPEK